MYFIKNITKFYLRLPVNCALHNPNSKGLQDYLLLFAWFSQKKSFSLMPGCSSAAFTLTVCFTFVSFIKTADSSSVIQHTLVHLTWWGIKFGAFGFDFSHTSDLFRLTGSLILILYIDSYTLNYSCVSSVCKFLCVCACTHVYLHTEEVISSKIKRFTHLESFKKEIHVQNLW